MKAVFLGTSGSLPTPERSSSSVAIIMGRSAVLLDCGEGTQRQMVAAHIGFSRIKLIFITHLHGDHVLGTPGLLQSMTLQRREEPLEIFGPPGTHAFLQSVSNTLGGPGFPVTIHEVTVPGVIYESKGFAVEACKAEHRLLAWAYAVAEKPRPGRFHPEKARRLRVPEGALWKRLQGGEEVSIGDNVVKPRDVCDAPRPGRRIVYTGDTKPSENVINLAHNADLLIHEATFGDDLIDRAAEDGHSTASQAADVAAKAGVKRLILTHISSRYGDTALLLEAARKIFVYTTIAKDLQEIEVPLT